MGQAGHRVKVIDDPTKQLSKRLDEVSVSYTHLRAHETVLDLVCRLLLEKKKNTITKDALKC